MKRYFRGYAKEGELSYQVAKRFAKESTKEDFAKKIMEIIKGDGTDWETISEIAYLCESVEEGNEMTKTERMKEIAKEYPDFGKRVGYKMCMTDELEKENCK